MPSDENSNDASRSNARLYAELERSLALCKIAEIELALKAASREEGQNDYRGGVSSAARLGVLERGVGQVDTAEEESSKSNLPGTLGKDDNSEKKLRSIAHLSEQEKLSIYTDVYGSKPQSEVQMEEYRDEFEHELRQIPSDKKRALLQAQKAFPLLICTAAHIDLFLQAEDYNAKLAAERMAKYWEQRLKLLGSLAFSPEYFQKPTKNDYLRMHKKSMRTILDPDTDEMTKETAKKWLTKWNKTKITNLDSKLRSMAPNDRAVFVEAQEKLPNVISSDDHKLLFLQCEDFSEAAAAWRMLRYWRNRNEIFGNDAFKPITLESLKEHSSKISLGFIWLLPGMDAFGRKLFCLTCSSLPPEGKYSSAGYEMALWYVTHAALEEETAQRNGCVIILDLDHKNSSQNRDLLVKVMPLLGVMPIKMKAMHVINSDLCFRDFIDQGDLSDSDVRTFMKICERSVMHIGSDDEIINELAAFGIKKEQLPVEMGGSVGAEYRVKWLKERMEAGK